MINGPDRNVEGMCEGVQPCAQVPYHFLTTAHHTEYSDIGENSTIRCVGLPLASDARQKPRRTESLKCVRRHVRNGRIAPQLQHWLPQTKADATQRLTPRACFFGPESRMAHRPVQ